ncbi:MAG: sodium:solute symporter family protein [Pseudomonadota bacterium]
MPDLTEHWLALLGLAVYGCVLLANARVGLRQKQLLSEYYVGGRGFGGVAIGFSFFATYASTNSYIGNAGKGYSYGLPWFSLATLIVVFTYLSWRYVAPRMRALAADGGTLTLPEFFAFRFPSASPVLRSFTALIIVVASLLYLLAIFKGAGHLFQLFLGISYAGAVFLTLVLVVAYTALGGFHSVVRTDLLQGLLMLLGSVAIGYCVISAGGGLAGLDALRQTPASAPLFTLNAGAPFAVVLGIAVAGSLKLLVDPRQTSRFFALRDAASVRQGLIVALIGIGVIQFALAPVGLFAHRLLPAVTDTDLIVPTLLNDPLVFSWWLRELLVVAILAAAMSSLDSVLLVAASVLYRDLLAPRIGPVDDQKAVGITRWCVVGFALLAALLALRPPAGIVELTTFSGSLYAVCFLPATLFGLYWRRGDARTVVLTMSVGIAVLLLWLLLGFNKLLHEVFPALAASTLTYCLAAARTGASPLLAASSLRRSGVK